MVNSHKENFFELFNNNKNIIILLFLLSLFIPFIDFPPYVDDEARFTLDYIGLFPLGRITPEFFYRFITHAYVADIYIFNLTFVALVSLMNLRVQRIKDNVVLFFLLFSSPFLLENISYHVDIVGMLPAYVLSIYAAFYENKNTKTMVLICFAISFVSIISYQAALNSFATCAVASTLLDVYHKNEQLKRNVIVRSINFIFLVFSIKFVLFSIRLLLNLFGHDVSKYIDERSKFGFSGVSEQIDLFCNLFFSSFNESQFLLLFILFLLSVFGVVSYSLNNKSNAFELFVLCLSIPLSIFFTVFPYVFIDMPQVIIPRILYGFGGVLLNIYMLSYYFNARKLKLVSNAIAALYIVLFLASVSAYTSTYKKSIELESNFYKKINFIIDSGLGKTNILDKHIYLCGKNSIVMNNKYVHVNTKAFPVISNLLNIHQSNSGWTGSIQGLYVLNGLPFISESCTTTVPMSSEILYQEKFYTLYKLNDITYQIVYRNPK